MSLFLKLLEAPFEEDTRELIYPGKVPQSGLPHWLTVEDEQEDSLAVEHTRGCLDQWGEIGCDVEHYERDGLDIWFHRADLGDDGTSYSDGVRPGRYLIEAWSSRSYCHDYGTYEFDGGLALVYPEEAA